MTERNYSIDILKFVCAVLVVFLHTNWTFQQVFLPFTRCAVPCFFIISGYLLFDKKGIRPERLKRNFVHVGWISLWASLFFVVWKEVTNLVSTGSFWVPSVESLLEWLLFNDAPFAFHLWYLFAYLYVLLIVMVINKYNKWMLLYCITPLLLLTDLAFGKYSLLFWGWEPPYIYVRNFLCVGLPYFAIGTLIRSKTDAFVSSCKKDLLIGGILLFTITSYLEKFLLIYLDKCAVREHYLSSTFLSVFLFLLALSVKSKNKSLISTMGEKDSLYIYIFHPVFIFCCSGFFSRIHLYDYYLYVAPLVVLGATIIFIKCIRRMRIIKE